MKEEFGNIWNSGFGKPLPNSLSLDRLIPSEGYIQGNVVWCSYFINTMKGNLSEREFYDLMNTILNKKLTKI